MLLHPLGNKHIQGHPQLSFMALCDPDPCDSGLVPNLNLFALHASPLRVFIKHQRSENPLATTWNFPAKFQWPVEA